MQKRLMSLSLIGAALLFLLTGCCGEPVQPSVEFEIQAAPATFSVPGQMITLAYTVRNPNQLMQVEIVDGSRGAVCEPFPLASSADQKTCTLLYTTTAADVAAGAIHISAVARASAESEGCATEPLTSEINASLELALVADESTAPLDPSNWPIFSVACNPDTTQMDILIDTGYAWLTPQARAVFSASDGETTYTCEVPDLPGRVRCYGSQSSTPGPLTFCIQRDTDPSPVCRTYTDFPDWLVGLSCQPEWELLSTGCDGTTQIFFVIDTGYEWMESGGLYSFTADDGEVTYWCAAAQDPGKVNCYGQDPVSPGPLEFCFQRPEDTSPVCKTFADFPARMNSYTCQPTPTVPVACSSITSPTTCQSTPGCKWDTSPNKCVPKP